MQTNERVTKSFGFDKAAREENEEELANFRFSMRGVLCPTVFSSVLS